MKTQNILILLLLVLLFISCSDSTSPSEEPKHFIKTFSGIEARDILSVGDGFIILGSTNEKGNGGENIYLFKIDLHGNIVWEKTYGSDENDRGYSLLKTSDDNLLIGGYSHGFRYNEQQMYLVKTSLDGTVQWANAFIDPTDVNAFGQGCVYDVIETNNGKYLAVGSGMYTNGSSGSGSTRAVSLDKMGYIEWIKTYEPIWGFGQSIVETENQFMIVGDFPILDDDIFLVDDTGEIKSSISLPNFKSIYFSITKTNDGNFILCGETHNSSTDFQIVKISTLGEYIWSKTFSNDYYDRPYDIQSTTDGGYIVVGTTAQRVGRDYDIYLLKINSDGSKEWDKTIDQGMDDVAFSIQQLNDNGYIFVGKTYDAPNPENSEILIIRTDENGNINK